MNVYCLACGADFATDAKSGDHGYPLNNGVCHPCVREARKPNHRLIAENERLRDELTALCAYCNHLGIGSHPVVRQAARALNGSRDETS